MRLPRFIRVFQRTRITERFADKQVAEAPTIDGEIDDVIVSKRCAKIRYQVLSVIQTELFPCF